MWDGVPIVMFRYLSMRWLGRWMSTVFRMKMERRVALRFCKGVVDGGGWRGCGGGYVCLMAGGFVWCRREGA